MGYIEVEAAQLDATLASPKLLGRKRFGTRNPKLDRPLRKAVRLLIEGTAKSGRNALIRVLGDNHPQFDNHYRRLNERKVSLLRQAARAKEIEIKCGQAEITSFDLLKDKDAPIGTFALINQDSKHWGQACRAGWHPVEYFGDGEALIRRDLYSKLIDTRTLEESEPIKRWSLEMAAFFGESR